MSMPGRSECENLPSAPPGRALPPVTKVEKKVATQSGPTVPARRFNRRPSQRESWINIHGHPQHSHLVGQIFFRSGEPVLDADDYWKLDHLCQYMVGYIKRYDVLNKGRILFNLQGHADHTGRASFNLALSKKRAAAVQAVVDEYFQDFPYYYVQSEGLGESRASRKDLAGSRRVDILSTVTISRDESHHFDEEIVAGKYRGPRTNRFGFKTVIGAGVDFWGVGGSVVTVQIKNMKTNRKAYYTFSGAGGGLGVGINRPSDWTEKTLPLHMSVEDFEGNGQVLAAGLVAGHSTLFFDGPKERGLYPDSIQLDFDGWDLNVGFASHQGYWNRVDW